jgi:hypothetical protein
MPTVAMLLALFTSISANTRGAAVSGAAGVD